MSSTTATTSDGPAVVPSSTPGGDDLQVSFSHVQLYVDHVHELQVYKDLEDRLNRFHEQVDVSTGMTLDEKRQLYKSLKSTKEHDEDDEEESFIFIPQNRDVIQQLLVGFGFRITGSCYPEVSPGSGGVTTRSVLVTSKDQSGAQFVITSAVDENSNSDENNVDDPPSGASSYHHFDASKF